MHPVRILHGWRYWVLWPLTMLLKLWGRTLRMEVEDAASLDLVRELKQPYVLFIWHNRLFVVAEAYRRYLRAQPMAGLVSASRDGAWLSAFFRLCGIHPVRGSSSRRGGAALSGLVGAMRDGYSVAITPDGPRGPCYSIKPGVVWLCEHTKSPLLLLNFSINKAWRLKTWDRFYIPKPFSKIFITGRLFNSIDELRAAYPAESAQQSIQHYYEKKGIE